MGEPSEVVMKEQHVYRVHVTTSNHVTIEFMVLASDPARAIVRSGWNLRKAFHGHEDDPCVVMAVTRWNR